MITLRSTCLATDRDGVAHALKTELEALGPSSLPLAQATNQGGRVDGAFRVSLLDLELEDTRIRARVAVLFQEEVGGCSCGDEPYASEVYCELGLVVDRHTGEAKIQLLPD